MPLRNYSLLSLLLSLLVVTLASAAEKPSKKSKKSSATPKAAKGMDSVAADFPLNVPNLNVKAPSFEDGRLASRLRAEVMTRTSDTTLVGKNVRIEVFSKNPLDNLTVTMSACVYHLDTKLITSDQRCQVRKPTLVIEGDRMSFDTNTHTGTFDGNVKTVVTDANSVAAPKPAAVTSSTK
jgi:hypothetical protein